MLRIYLAKRVPNAEENTRVDVGRRIREVKWRWAGHLARLTNGRWTEVVTEWRPREAKGPGRPPDRWVDDFLSEQGRTWIKFAQNRKKWCSREEA